MFLSQGRSLRVPLGRWTYRDETYQRWFLDVNSKFLFYRQSETDRWKVFKREGGRGVMKKGNTFRFMSTCLQNSSSAVRATVTKNANNNRVTLSGWGECSQEANYASQACNNWTGWFTNNSHNTQEERSIIEAVKYQRAQFVLVSDGSFHPELLVGASAWVITSSEDYDAQLHGNNIIPGPTDIQCSHRSELGGGAHWRHKPHQKLV